MDRIRLIELIEGEMGWLSPEGRGLWEELEFLREAIPDPEEQSRMAREYDLTERIFDLPMPEQFVISRLAELVGGLRKSEKAEEQGESGDEHRVGSVINAAWLKDRQEGRAIDPDITLDHAIARLNE
jgi:hypothetical protein